MVRGSGKISPLTLQNFHPENPHPSNFPLETPPSPQKKRPTWNIPFRFFILSYQKNGTEFLHETLAMFKQHSNFNQHPLMHAFLTCLIQDCSTKCLYGKLPKEKLHQLSNKEFINYLRQDISLSRIHCEPLLQTQNF